MDSCRSRGAAPPAPAFARGPSVLCSSMLRALVLLASFGGACLVSGQVAAAAGAPAFPVKPIRMLIPFAPGGGNDVIARLVSPRLAESLGQPILIDNRPGAGGVLASEITARAVPDGYTVILASSTHGFAPAMQARQPYDPVRDFTAITLIGTSPLGLVVNPGAPARDAGEFIAAARKANPAVTLGSGGVGSIGHLAGELLQMRTGIKLTHIPYKGAGPAMTDLVAGHVQVAFLTPTSALSLVKAGKLRVLAVTGKRRAPGLEQIPTLAEQGIQGVDVEQWWGWLGPAGVARVLVERLHGEFTRALAAPEVRERSAELGIIMADSSPDGFRRFLEREVSAMVAVIRAAGIRAE
jgi:tripartite-type tricarboxylate transporter receptor subunit TctC